MRRSNCAGALQYVPELTWILFLRILDEREAHEAEEAEALGLSFTPSLAEPYRWRDWAAPGSPLREDKKASLFDFVHGQLLPHLKAMKDKPGATGRQKVISEIMSSVERSRVDSEKNFADGRDYGTAMKSNPCAGGSQREPIASDSSGSVRGSGDRPGLQTQCGD